MDDAQEDHEALEYKVLVSMDDFNWAKAYRRDPVFRSIYNKLRTSSVSEEDGYSLKDDLLMYKTLKGIWKTLHIAHVDLRLYSNIYSGPILCWPLITAR